MSEFVAELRAQVDQARQGVVQARGSGDEAVLHRYSARLLDLLQRASAHGVDAVGWVPTDVLAVARATAGDGT